MAEAAQDDSTDTLVVVESEFGNTRKIADVLAAALGDHAEIVPVTVAPSVVPEGVRLLVIGGPTHAFGMSTTASRAYARSLGGAPTTGIREWITQLRPSSGCWVATFDTRQSSRFPGSAARRAAKALARKGFRQLDPPRTFHVLGTTGPLDDGETKRAIDWGHRLCELVAEHDQNQHDQNDHDQEQHDQEQA